MSSPTARSRDQAVEEILHGQKVSDPYRWLEDSASADTRAWIASQNRRTVSYLSARPGRSTLQQRVEQLLDVESRDTPLERGSNIFFLGRRVSEQQPSIYVSSGSVTTRLIDPAVSTGNAHCSVHIVDSNKTGSYLAYGEKYGGEDAEVIRLMDVERRHVLGETLPRGYWYSLEWSEHEDGFYYTNLVPGAASSVRYHRLHTTPLEDREIFAAQPDDNGVGFRCLPNGALLCVVRRAGTSPLSRVYLVEPTAYVRSELLAEVAGYWFTPIVDGEDIYVLTDAGSPNRRIVKFSTHAADPKHWVDVVLESNMLIKRFCIAGGQLFVSYAGAEGSLIRRFTTAGVELEPLVPSFMGTVELFRSKPDNRHVFYRRESFVQAPAIFQFDAATGELQEWHSAAHQLSGDHYRAEHASAPSKDGTPIPYWVLYGDDHTSTPGIRPTIMTAYGGFGAVMTPRFSVLVTILLEMGCRFVLVNARGGGEFGEAWHLAGSRRNRQASFDDVIGVAEALIAKRHATPDRMAIIGGSNSGLVAGALITQRPDLFRAALCIGPILDMLRYHLFDLSGHWASEYGVADGVEDFKALLAYSPYHNIRSGVAYPAVLFVTGDRDTRCNPMHVRKMAARLQMATSSDRPILVDHSEVRGHSATLPLANRVSALTDRLAFLSDQLDLVRSGG